jgi:hypothetical protein
VSPSPHLQTETGPVFEKLRSLVIQNSERYTKSTIPEIKSSKIKLFDISGENCLSHNHGHERDTSKHNQFNFHAINLEKFT